MTKKLDWKRIGWTVGIIAYLAIGILLTYHFYASHWTSDRWVEGWEPTSPNSTWGFHTISIVHDVPQHWYWELLGSLGITVATPVALFVAGVIIYGIYTVLAGLITDIVGFYYHPRSEEEKEK